MYDYDYNLILSIMVKTQTDLHWNWTSIEQINTTVPLQSYSIM